MTAHQINRLVEWIDRAEAWVRDHPEVAPLQVKLEAEATARLL